MLVRFSQRWHGRGAADEAGFTLIELLVVIIIIGILAGIAIPVYLHQRNKSYDAAVKTDLHHAALAEQTYFINNDVFTPSMNPGLKGVGFKASPSSNYKVAMSAEFLTSANVKSTTVKDAGYCLRATSASGNVFSFDSLKGGLRTGGCP